jgi:DNA-binding CsgD family transcriptional regulator
MASKSKGGKVMAYLQDESGSRTPLGKDGLTLGRDENNDIAVSHDLRLSRSHAQVVNRDGQWILTDLGSRNGSFVNARPVTRHPLRDGDEIRLGGSLWMFRSDLDPRATEVATETSAPGAELNLTKREVEVLRLVSDGLSDKLIAADLGISVNTVRSHLDRIGEKTGLRKRSELTRLALTLKI